MKINSDDIKKTLTLSTLSEMKDIHTFQSRAIELSGSEFLVLPQHAEVTPFIFQSEDKIFGGVVTDFVLEKTGKLDDPFVIESEYTNVVTEIKKKAGFLNAKIYNPIPGSEVEVEGLPCSTGDCFIFAL